MSTKVLGLCVNVTGHTKLFDLAFKVVSIHKSCHRAGYIVFVALAAFYTQATSPFYNQEIWMCEIVSVYTVHYCNIVISTLHKHGGFHKREVMVDFVVPSTTLLPSWRNTQVFIVAGRM